MNGLKALWSRYRGIILSLAAVGGLCLLRFALGLPCPIQYVTGVSCPGCGMTRALWSLVTLDPVAAWRYHPACFAVIAALPPLLLFRIKGMKRATALLLTLFVLLMLAVYVCRLATGNSDVVTADPQSGLIGRLIDRVFPLF